MMLNCWKVNPDERPTFLEMAAAVEFLLQKELAKRPDSRTTTPLVDSKPLVPIEGIQTPTTDFVSPHHYN